MIIDQLILFNINFAISQLLAGPDTHPTPNCKISESM